MDILRWFVSGLFLWTLLEYFTHRWVLHTLMGRHHRVHHVKPRSVHRIPGILAYPALAIIALISPALSFGVFAGWQYYEYFHATLHTPTVLKGYMRRRRKVHAVHHRNPRCNFGVTTGLWDWVFRTRCLAIDCTVGENARAATPETRRIPDGSDHSEN